MFSSPSSADPSSTSSSKKKSAKKTKQQKQTGLSTQISAANTTTLSSLSASQNFSSPIPTHSSSFTPKKQANTIQKDFFQQSSLTSPLASSVGSTNNSASRDLAQANSEEFLNSLSFAFPQIEYEEVMKKIQQQQQQQQQVSQRNHATAPKPEGADDNNITAENIDATSEGYDFEYVNKEEEAKRNKKNAKSSKSSSSSSQKRTAEPSNSSTINYEKNNNTSTKTPLKQKVSSDTPSSKSKNSKNSGGNAVSTLEQGSFALSSEPVSVIPSKSRISLRPSTSSRQVGKKNKSLLRSSVSKSFSNFVSKSSTGNSSDQVISVVMDSSPTFNEQGTDSEDDDDGDDKDHCHTSKSSSRQDIMMNITAMNCHHHDDSEEDAEHGQDSISSPTTPNKKRKANADFTDSPASSKKKKEDSLMDSVIKKVMEFSIPNTPPHLEEESPAQSTALTISPSLSYNSDSTCGEQVLDVCSTSPHDDTSYDTNLLSSVSDSSTKGIDIKEVNQRISSLVTVIEKRNEQIAQRDALIMQLSKENKDLKKFKNMIEKLEDVGVVFYMKASELCCNGLMARDDKSKDSMEVVASSVQQGMRYMRASAEFGNVDAMFEYAELMLRYSKNKKSEAKEYLKKASDLGHKKAAVFLKSLENKEEQIKYEKSIEHDHLFLYGNETKNNQSKKRR